jgi:hypothetical protein
MHLTYHTHVVSGSHAPLPRSSSAFGHPRAILNELSNRAGAQMDFVPADPAEFKQAAK